MGDMLESATSWIMKAEDRLARGNASSPGPGDPRVGQVVADRYELVTRIGPGTLGIVYEARHVSLDRLVTLELLEADLIDREAVRERFKSVMQQLAKVRHRNVAEVESFGIDPDGSLYVVTKHVAATGLHELIARERRLPWARARALGIQIAAAIDAAHKRSVMHGGLRPDVCRVITKAPGAEQIVVGNFALSEIAVETRFASDAKGATAQLAGDPRYLALEQLVTGHCSVAADVYAVGAILYHALAGVPPHSGVNAFHALHQRRDRAVVPPRELEPSIPLEVEGILLRALAVEPGARHSSARELADALEAIPADRAIVVHERPCPAPTPISAFEHPEAPPLAIAPRIAEESLVFPTHMMPPWNPAAIVDDEATAMMAKLVPPGGPSMVEATTMLDLGSMPLGLRPEETTVLVIDELGTLPVAPSASRVDRAAVPPPTERLASVPLSPKAGQLAPPTILTPAPNPRPSLDPISAPSTPRIPSPSLHVPVRMPTSPPVVPVQAAAVMASPSVSIPVWLLVLGAVLIVAVGTLIGLALARASAPDRASRPTEFPPEATPKPRSQP